MKKAFLLAVLAATLAPARAAAADQTWIRVVTPNFELYTSDSEGRARETILHFEKVRAFFLEAHPGIRLPAERIRLLGFGSEREYRPFQPRESTPAYYSVGAGRQAIVLENLDSAHRAAAAHEFVHLILYAIKARAPLWLNEGMAQLYETIASLGSASVRVGEIPRGRLNVLAQRRWLPLEDLLAADAASRYYAQPDMVPLFYSQSWALTHMLILSDQYRPKGTEFLNAVLAGENAADAIPRIYGRTLQQVRQDLEQYTERTIFRVMVFPFGAKKPNEKPEIRPATPLEWRMAQADVLAGGLRKWPEAKIAYEKLASDFPKDWQPHAGLAYLALMEGDSLSALDRFARADELGCDDAKAYVDYGRLALGRQGVDAVKLLEKALALKADSQETVYQLSIAFYYARDYRRALEAMARMKSVDADQAAELFSAMAICAHFTGDERMAKNAAQRALKEARTDDEKKRIARQLELLDRPALELAAVAAMPPLKREDEMSAPHQIRRPVSTPAAEPNRRPEASGLLVHFDCLGEGALLWILDGDRKRGYSIPTGNQIVVLRDGEDVVYDFQCGPQKEPAKVTIHYDSRGDLGPGVEGIAKTLELR